MNLPQLTTRVMKTLVDNSSVILTGASVSGTVVTAIFAAKGHADAQMDLWMKREDTLAHDLPYPTKANYVKEYWRHYVPAATAGVVTVACTIGIHTTNHRRQAALISAYSVVDKAFQNYRQQVTETVGEKHERAIHSQTTTKELEANPVGSNEVFITGTGEQLCYDTLTGRYFKSDIEAIRKAVNDTNAQIINEMYASQNQFYERIGLAPASVGEELGWDTSRLMEIEYTSHLAEDGRPCLALNYIPTPVRNYWRMGQ